MAPSRHAQFAIHGIQWHNTNLRQSMGAKTHLQLFFSSQLTRVGIGSRPCPPMPASSRRRTCHFSPRLHLPARGKVLKAARPPCHLSWACRLRWHRCTTAQPQAQLPHAHGFRAGTRGYIADVQVGSPPEPAVWRAGQQATQPMDRGSAPHSHRTLAKWAVQLCLGTSLGAAPAVVGVLCASGTAPAPARLPLPRCGATRS